MNIYEYVIFTLTALTNNGHVTATFLCSPLLQKDIKYTQSIKTEACYLVYPLTQ